MSRTIDIDGRQVFVKSIPVTELELEHPGSTRNLFDLPVVYQYGVGSAGFGTAREVAAHIKTTDWVLDGHIANFPLLYHQRLVELPGQALPMDPDELARYMAAWDDDPAIRNFIAARERSTHSILLFIEHFPHVLQDWLPLNQERVGEMIDQALAVTTFLRDHDVAHFDAHPSNMLTNGARLLFADFGLFLDADFELAAEERTFLAEHRFFDIGEFIASLDWPVPGQTVDQGPAYLQAMAAYRPLITEMTRVFKKLAGGPRTAGGYSDSTIERLLDQAQTSAS